MLLPEQDRDKDLVAKIMGRLDKHVSDVATQAEAEDGRPGDKYQIQSRKFDVVDGAEWSQIKEKFKKLNAAVKL